MSGRLIILPKKSYCPWNPKNIERVERDEKEHREQQELYSKQQSQQESQARIRHLRQRKQSTDDPHWNHQRSDRDNPEPSSPTLQRFHLFEAEERTHRLQQQKKKDLLHNPSTTSLASSSGNAVHRQRRKNPGPFPSTPDDNVPFYLKKPSSNNGLLSSDSTLQKEARLKRDLDPMKMFLGTYHGSTCNIGQDHNTQEQVYEEWRGVGRRIAKRSSFVERSNSIPLQSHQPELNSSSPPLSEEKIPSAKRRPQHHRRHIEHSCDNRGETSRTRDERIATFDNSTSSLETEKRKKSKKQSRRHHHHHHHKDESSKKRKSRKSHREHSPERKKQKRKGSRRSTYTSTPSMCLLLILTLLSIDLVSSNPTSDHGELLYHFELRPTSSLVEEKIQGEQRRQRHRLLRNEHTNHQKDIFDVPSEWFHPLSRAVYATLHTISQNVSIMPEESPYFIAYQDFVKYRHLSRFERQLRSATGLDMHPYWHGNYSNTSYYKEILTRDQENGNSTKESFHKRRLLESMVGGRFDHYQGVPLSQGYGTHYVHLWVGNPTPQRQSVIVDTGSHFTGFPVKGCTGCGERHHTDPHFDPSKSESFQALSCPHECLESYSCDNSLLDRSIGTNIMVGSRCKFKQAYTEGSSWVAYQAKDIVYCGGTDLIDAVDPFDMKYSIPFVFGCLIGNTGLFVTQLADGIMGMSAHELTLPKQLYNAGKLEYNMFALCFRKELGTSRRGVTAGSMTLGGVSSTLDTSPMLYARNVQPYGWYTVFVEAIYVASNGGSTFLFDSEDSTRNIIKIPMDSNKFNIGRGVIMDSGTTDTYINSSIQSKFVKIWKKVTGMDYNHGPLYLTQSQLKRLPTLLIQMQAAVGPVTLGSSVLGEPLSTPVVGQAGYLDPDRWTDLVLAIPATNYMEYSSTLKVYTSRLFFTESRGGVLGANSMQGHNVVFDWQHGRIGMAQSSCAYDLIAGKNDNHVDYGSSSESFINECILATDRPILSQTCMESVNVAICKASDYPTNIDISGMEIWTLLVEAPGDPGSCEIAIQEWSDSQDTIQQVDPSITNCTMSGICQEFRPCHVPCMEAIKYHKNLHDGEPTKAEAVTVPHPVVSDHYSNDSNDDDCRNWFWSACDYSCRQTRVSSSIVKHDIGQYCVATSTESRSCHVDACGRSDPCIVPFLVHAIFVLEGTPIEWTPQVEDFFQKELAIAAHLPDTMAATSGKDVLFEIGDVSILATRTWYGSDSDDLYLDEDETLRDNGVETNNGAMGTQLILQISVANPKASLLKHAPYHHHHHHSRRLLQTVGSIWSNITEAFQKPAPTSMCDPYDLFPLALKAREISNIVVADPQFLVRLVQNMDDYDRARLISSWTIGTQIYDESINYLGPLASTPFFFLAKFLHEVFVVMTIAWLGVCAVKGCRILRPCVLRTYYKHYSNGPHYNKLLSTKVDAEDDHHVTTTTVNSKVHNNSSTNNNNNGCERGRAALGSAAMEVEMTVTYLRSSKTVKRRTSTPEY